MNIVQSVIIGIVEGITEFIPISSTGHMIIAEKLLNIGDDAFNTVFTVAIQLGAILSVVVLYWKKFFDFSRWQFYVKLAVAVVPALVIGFLFSSKIDDLLESSITVAITMLAGGIILLFIDNVFKNPEIHNEREVSYTKGFIIGIWQCIAMIPGVSRSAASIIGGMQQKLTRSAAAEFSFFLAVPTMLAATVYKIFKYIKQYGAFTSDQIKILTIGNIVAFVVALLAIKFFITMLKKYGFRMWGIYRVLVGIILLIMLWTGYLKP
ncbi:undecaprenyl-diphosphate phosphatase [Ginsengibacter hankyongi]|uniref:Undecaprenyl-diphosphatase n=1 Tax=Ginsengibacter hankyongi TaxID=2607284 RepID=A0A5J5IMK2_9BACT|nr:undecaprenyl-diphosphate phosphatase [Ginsengibacter hankyongi]KAA9042169.1 undecaprenyl-diphosphate phosphatase [Ginsengibacter hankyongi]